MIASEQLKRMKFNFDFITGSFSDDDQENDNEPLPDFLLPNYSHPTDRSPQFNRNRASSPPKIIKSSLKNFSGLEGSHLPSQDSVDYPGLKSRPPDTDQDQGSGDQVSESATAPSIVSINQENRVKIQVPGLPVSKTSKTSLTEH